MENVKEMTGFEMPTFRFDTASAVSKGAREYQEDALVSDFSEGSDLGFVVISDGMGGHAAGDLASKIVITEMFSELTFMGSELLNPETSIPDFLRNAAMLANETLKAHIDANPETRGMGATLVSTILIDENLYWISIGDSPLFLFRDGDLIQLNDDHSMGQAIDTMVKSGVLSVEDGASHPDRNVLTSALVGGPIPAIDCPTKPTKLRLGDVLIVASDGIQFLTDSEIKSVLRDSLDSRSCDIAEVLMTSLADLEDPDLDNVSMSIIRVTSEQEHAISPFSSHTITEHASLAQRMLGAKYTSGIFGGLARD